MRTTGTTSKQVESKLNTNRKTARIVGVLFIIATVASLLGAGFRGPILDAPDYLGSVSSHGNRVIAGALLSFLAAVTSSGIALSLYPVLKKHSEGLAIGAVGFRLIEGVFYMVGALCLLALLPVSHQFVSAAPQDAPTLQTIGHLLLAVNDLAGFVFGVLAFCLGGLMYYPVFYQAKLIPRWLSVWGIVALVLLLAAVFLTLFDGEPYSVSGNLIFLALPIFLQEMVMAVWLIVKGFNSSAIDSGTSNQEKWQPIAT